MLFDIGIVGSNKFLDGFWVRTSSSIKNNFLKQLDTQVLMGGGGLVKATVTCSDPIRVQTEWRLFFSVLQNSKVFFFLDPPLQNLRQNNFHSVRISQTAFSDKKMGKNAVIRIFGECLLLSGVICRGGIDF